MGHIIGLYLVIIAIILFILLLIKIITTPWSCPNCGESDYEDTMWIEDYVRYDERKCNKCGKTFIHHCAW